MSIILTRHAHTIENRDAILHGGRYRGFTEQGKLELAKLSKELGKYRFDKAYVSDLIRAKETAEYILYQREQIIEYEPLIREKDNGRFAGKKINKIAWESLPGTFESRKPPGGESLAELKIRVDKFIEKLKGVEIDEILVVSHGAFLKVLIGTLLGFNLKKSILELTVDHCSISRIRKEGDKFIVSSFNQTLHLN